MKCSKCGCENLLKANYCCACGNAFTDEEKKSAREKALIGKVEKAEELKEKVDKISDFLSMKFITDNIFVRIALIVVPFILSFVLSGGESGNTMKILESSEYEIYYNTTTMEYFIQMDGNSVDLMLYVPKSTETINIYFTNSSGYQYQQGSYSTNDAISVNENSDGYYTIEAIIGDETQSIKMYTVGE